MAVCIFVDMRPPPAHNVGRRKALKMRGFRRKGQNLPDKEFLLLAVRIFV